MSTPTEILSETLAALKAAKIPTTLQEVAFAKTFDLLSGNVKPPGDGPAPGQDGSGTTGATRGGGSSGGGTALGPGLAKIAAELKVDPSLIDDFFTEEDGDIRLSLHDSELGSDIKTRVGNGALLLVAGRQFGQYDNTPTTYAMIRQRLDAYGLTDSNFAANLKKVANYFNIGGSGTTATYKLRSPGRTAASALAKQIIESR